jgi:hypothetical protein
MPMLIALREQDYAFSPEDVAALVAAYEAAARELGLVGNVTDLVTTKVAKVIIELAKQGERDPDRLRKGAIKILRGT